MQMTSKRHHQTEPIQDGAKRVMIKKESEVEMVAIAYKIPDFKHKDQVALSALSELLSSGKSSRLQRVLVDEKISQPNLWLCDAITRPFTVFIFSGLQPRSQG